jgi:phage terminase large subunit-like protein
VHDDLGVVSGPRSELFEALETSVAAQECPLSIVISTQAESDSDLLSVLLDDAASGRDPRIMCMLYTAPPNADPFALETIRLANPAIGVYQNPDEVLQMARDARAMPSRLAAYRRRVLNQRIAASAPFVLAAEWQACAGMPRDLTGADVVAGLDLSETRDLTCLCLIGLDVRDGSWSVQPTFFLPSEGLHERARADKIPYDQWRDEGYLEVTPGSTVSYEYVAHRLRDVFERHHVRKIAFDRWNCSTFRRGC